MKGLMEKAFVIHTNGYSMEAAIEYQHKRFHVMDKFSPPGGTSEPGFIHNARFGCMIFTQDTPGKLCDSCKKELHNLDSWNYHGCARIISLNPTVVDFGLFTIELDLAVTEPDAVGKWLCGKISRLELHGDPVRPVKLQRPFLGSKTSRK
jgi:hypothetical protein